MYQRAQIRGENSCHKYQLTKWFLSNDSQSGFQDVPTLTLKIPWHPADSWRVQLRSVSSLKHSLPCAAVSVLLVGSRLPLLMGSVISSEGFMAEGLFVTSCMLARREKTTEHFAISSLKLHAGLQIQRPAPTYGTGHLHLALCTLGKDFQPSLASYLWLVRYRSIPLSRCFVFPLQSVMLLRQQDLEMRFAKRNQLTCRNHKRWCHRPEIEPIHHQWGQGSQGRCRRPL